MIAEKVKSKNEWYEWLRSYQEICDKIDFLKFELRRYEIELGRWMSGDLSEIKLQRESLGANVEDNIADVEERIIFYSKQRDELARLVDTFKGLDHQILKMKYVDGMKLGDIADKLNYSHEHIRRKHAEIVQNMLHQ